MQLRQGHEHAAEGIVDEGGQDVSVELEAGGICGGEGRG
jgi:hypothetical protein